jgi:hypothetical protein
MSKEEIRKLIWDWETFSSKKENASINEEVLSGCQYYHISLLSLL